MDDRRNAEILGENGPNPLPDPASAGDGLFGHGQPSADSRSAQRGTESEVTTQVARGEFRADSARTTKRAAGERRGTALTRVVEDAVADAMENDPATAAAVRTFAERLRAKFYDPEWMDFVRQHEAAWSDLDAFTFGKLWGWIFEGEVSTTEIQVGSLPAPDAEIDRNRILLSRLPRPFSANIWCGKEEQDGVLKWDKPLQCGHLLGDGKELKTAPSPGSVPLEIGRTTGAVTLRHLLMHGGLARWPYGRTWITLVIVRRGVIDLDSMFACAGGDRPPSNLTSRRLRTAQRLRELRAKLPLPFPAVKARAEA